VGSDVTKKKMFSVQRIYVKGDGASSAPSLQGALVIHYSFIRMHQQKRPSFFWFVNELH